jgi:2'-5' RNA ligase
MVPMQVTSHFIGISVDSGSFADVFINMQKYFEDHDLQHAVELQNILSLHITLYYLGSSISEAEKTQILNDISEVSSQHGILTISQLKSHYFGDPGKEQVCYLGGPQNKTLEAMNKFFAKKYNHSQIPENQLAFVPHISIFRINNAQAYAPHKAEVDALLHKNMQSIDHHSLLKNVRLFQVCSLFHPEIQIPL